MTSIEKAADTYRVFYANEKSIEYTPNFPVPYGRTCPLTVQAFDDCRNEKKTRKIELSVQTTREWRARRPEGKFTLEVSILDTATTSYDELHNSLYSLVDKGDHPKVPFRVNPSKMQISHSTNSIKVIAYPRFLDQEAQADRSNQLLIDNNEQELSQPTKAEKIFNLDKDFNSIHCLVTFGRDPYSPKIEIAKTQIFTPPSTALFWRNIESCLPPFPSETSEESKKGK